MAPLCRLATLAMMLWVALPAWAATVSVSLAVPKIEVGQSTRLLVTVVGEQPRAVPTVETPDGVEVRFIERGHQFQSTPSGILYVYRYGFRVTATQEGRHQLGPVTVALGPDARTGQPATLTSGTVTLSAMPSGSLGRPDQPLQVTSVFLREAVWEGEVVLYQAKLITQLPILDVEWGFPDFAGLQVPPRGQAERTVNKIGDPGGDITVSQAIVPLVAAGTGDREQGPALARVRVMSGTGPLGTSRIRQRTEAGTRAPLKVRPLPTSPAGFSGLVGDFTLKAQVSKTELIAVGESVPLTVLVTGNGVADGFSLPEFEIEGIQVYENDDRTIGRMVNGRYYGEKEFKLTLVPGRVGRLDLPDLEVSTFSPTKGTYVTLKAVLGSLDVVGEDEQTEIKSFAKDGPVLADPEGIDAVDLRGVYTWGPAWTPPLAPLLPLLLGMVALPGLMALVADGAGGVRGWVVARGVAKTDAFRGGARLRKPPTEPEELLAVCDLALRETLADKTGVALGALRREQALSTLPEPVEQAVRRAFAGLDRARFAGGAVPADALERIRSAIAAVKSA